MKTIVAGSRNIFSYKDVAKAILDSGFTITELVSGQGTGVDRLGEAWAMENKITIKKFPANWDKFGKAAGPKRNEEMSCYAEALIAVHRKNNLTPGTANMIMNAKNKNLKIFVYEIEE